MLPRWHVLTGAIFTVAIWILAPNLSILQLALIFFATIFMDLDHYFNAIIKTKKIHPKHAFNYYKKLIKKEKQEIKKGIRRKGDFHLFHTIEFQALIGLIGVFWSPFFYLFIGMVFHSLMDLIWLLYEDKFYVREFFFFNWTRKILNKGDKLLG